MGTSVDTQVLVEGARAVIPALILRSLPAAVLRWILTRTQASTKDAYRDDRQLLLKYQAKREHTEG